MDDSDAQRFATEIADRLSESVRGLDASAFRIPITLADILRMGFFMAMTVRHAYPDAKDKFPTKPEFMSAMLAAIESPEQLRGLLYEGLVKSEEDPTVLEDQLEAVTSGDIRVGIRKEFVEVTDKFFPAQSPGRTKKIGIDALPKLATRAESIRPVLNKALRLLQSVAGRDVADALMFLKSEHPRECTYLINRKDQLHTALAHDAVQRAKTTNARARMIADIVAGSDFQLKPRYAIQKAQEGRRILRRRGTRTV